MDITELVRKIIQEFTGRCGFDSVWDDMDDELRDELRNNLENLIEGSL